MNRADLRAAWARIRVTGLRPESARGVLGAAGVDLGRPLAVALSGGADSVLLTRLVAAARLGTRSGVLVLHAEHALRGSESQAEAGFANALCAELGLPLARLQAPVAPGPGLEQRARQARYRAFEAELERRFGPGVAGRLLTGHTASDRLETGLWRWLRGGHLASLAPTEPRGQRPGPAGSWRIAHPLEALSRREVRRLLDEAGWAWREDSSNRSFDPARNRLRLRLLPALEAADGLGHLEDLLDRIEAFGAELARRQPRIAFVRLLNASAFAPTDSTPLGLDPSGLRGLPAWVLRSSLRELVLEATAGEPSRATLRGLETALGSRACGRMPWPGGFSLWFEPRRWILLAPRVTETWTRPQGVELPPTGRKRVTQLPDGRRLALHEQPAAALRAALLCIPSAAIDGSLSVEPVGPARRLPDGSWVKKRAAEAGIPAPLRQGLLWIEDHSGPLWVPGLWSRSALGSKREAPGAECLCLESGGGAGPEGDPDRPSG